MKFVVVGYVVMPEHFHALLSEPEIGTPSGIMRRVKHQTSRAIPHVEEHFWQHRFYDFNVWSPKKRAEKPEYMHMNPVVRGLVNDPKEWKWSSHAFYSFDEVGLVKVNEGWTEFRLVR